MLGSAAKGLMSLGRGYAGMLGSAAKAEKGGLNKALMLLSAGGVLGATPFIGSAIRANVPGGSILAPTLTGRENEMSRYVQSAEMANQANLARNLPRLPRGGPTMRGIQPRDAYGNPMKKTAFGNSIEDIKAAHKMRTKIAAAAPVVRGLDPSQVAAAAVLGTAGTMIVGNLLGSALNRLEDTKRNVKKQTVEKKTMGILSRVNPMVAEDPQTKAKARTLFGIIHRNSPYIAREPVVAASVINTMLNSPTELPTPGQFQEVAKLQKDTESARERAPFDSRPALSEVRDLARTIYGG